MVFLGVAVVMAGPGELVAACFPRLERLEAYRYDLIGSLAGIGAFTALSFLRAPSVVVGCVVAVARRRAARAGVAPATGGLALVPPWSSGRRCSTWRR